MPSTSAARVASSFVANGWPGTTPMRSNERRSSASSGSTGMNCSIQLRTLQNAIDVGSRRTSSGATGRSAAAGGGGALFVYSESVLTLNRSCSAWTFGRSPGPRICVRYRPRTRSVGERKTCSTPGGAAPCQAGPASRKSPPVVPFVRGVT